jgi:hypothetical protein
MRRRPAVRGRVRRFRLEKLARAEGSPAERDDRQAAQLRERTATTQVEILFVCLVVEDAAKGTDRA